MRIPFLVSLLCTLCTPALAGTAVYNGTIDGGDATADFGGSIYAYEIIGPVQVSTSGEYGYADTSISYDLDMYIEVYSGSFNPADTTQNLVDGIDDTDPLTLIAGTDYYLVARPLCIGDTGVYGFGKAALAR